MQIERYRIETEIGRGATATVYRAYDTVAGRYVALKLLHRKFSNDYNVRVRFVREAKIIAQLHHPAIIPILHAAQVGNDLFLVMPLLTGGSLADRLNRGPLSTMEILSVMGRIAPALDYAHNHPQKVIHRDVKPANILFDESGQAYLSDFGVLKQMEERHTLLDMTLLGTPAYMSPEQLNTPRDVDPRTDIYSLGVILFQMLTGSIPYDGDSVMSIAVKHMTAPVPSLHSFGVSIPSNWQKMVNKAMAKKPEARYQTGDEMLAAIGALSRSTVRSESTDKQRRQAGIVIGIIGLALLAVAAILLATRRPDLQDTAPPSRPPAMSPESTVMISGVDSPTTTIGAPAKTATATAAATATQTAPAMSSPTLPPAATSAPVVQARSNVYTRTGPGIDYPIFGSLNRNQAVPVIGVAPNGYWYLVLLSDGRAAWVAASYVTSPQGDIPVAATIPPLPPEAGSGGQSTPATATAPAVEPPVAPIASPPPSATATPPPATATPPPATATPPPTTTATPVFGDPTASPTPGSGGIPTVTPQP